MSGAARDCEALVDSMLGQPVNSLTSLAFVVGGALILARTGSRWLGWASIATGVGSFLFHGPMPPYAEWAHDVTLVWLLLVVAALGTRGEAWSRLTGLVAVAVPLALLPGLGDAMGVVIAIAAVGAVLRRHRSPSTLAALSLLAVVAVIGRLGATGGPLCVPDSLLQPHGLWHLGAAAALTWWAVSVEREKVEVA